MKKFLAMALAAVMVLALAACGSKNDTADDTGDAQDAQGGETQKLIVGFDAEFPPFGFIAADGTYDGFDLAMAKELCARLGWEYEAVAIDWNSKDAELSSGTINCIWNGFTYTGRENDYTFSDPYVDNSIVMVVKADSGITSLADRDQRKRGLQGVAQGGRGAGRLQHGLYGPRPGHGGRRGR